MIDRSRVRVTAGAVRELSSPGLIFCADSVTVHLPLTNSTYKIAVILPKVQVPGYNQTNMHLTYAALHDTNSCMVVRCKQNVRRDAGSNFT